MLLFSLFFEYHYVAVGRGFLVIFLLNFQTVIAFYPDFREHIFQGRAHKFAANILSKLGAFFVVSGINSIVYSLVQTGMNADYQKEKNHEDEKAKSV